MKKLKNQYKKNAFTMIEIIMSIIVSGIILSLSYKYYAQNRWINNVNTLSKNIYFLADKGIMDVTTGYINAAGGDCSNDHSYTDLSAGRMLDCTGYSHVYPIGGTKSTNGSESYVTNLLTQNMPAGKTCKLYMDNNAPDKYYLFIDCSDVNYDGGSNRIKKYIEQKINSYIKANLPTIYQSVDFKSTAINNNTGGNDHDAMLRILMKK